MEVSCRAPPSVATPQRETCRAAPSVATPRKVSCRAAPSVATPPKVSCRAAPPVATPRKVSCQAPPRASASRRNLARRIDARARRRRGGDARGGSGAGRHASFAARARARPDESSVAHGGAGDGCAEPRARAHGRRPDRPAHRRWSRRIASRGARHRRGANRGGRHRPRRSHAETDDAERARRAPRPPGIDRVASVRLGVRARGAADEVFTVQGLSEIGRNPGSATRVSSKGGAIASRALFSPLRVKVVKKRTTRNRLTIVLTKNK